MKKIPCSSPCLGKGLKKILIALLCVQFLVYTSACSLFVNHYQTIGIATDPPGAQIVVNGSAVGAAPVQAQVVRDQNAQILATKPGYQLVTRQTTMRISPWGVLDIVGGCFWLVPFFGLLGPGAWKQTPENITITLPPAEQRVQ